MWTLAVLRKDMGKVEIVKLSDKTIEKYEDDLEGLVYDVLEYQRNSIYYLLEQDMAIDEIDLTNREL
jgi:hypothetical protein